MNYKKYDFILFENYIDVINHYKDILSLAVLLKKCGYKVVIANYADEKEYFKNTDIEIIDIKNKFPRPQRTWTHQPKNKIHSLYSLIQYYRIQRKYMLYFLSQVNGMAHNYYCGSLNLFCSTVLFNRRWENVNFYFWGLRSFHLTAPFANFINNPILGIKSFYFKNKFQKNKTLKLLISNEMIKSEFEKLGIRPDRLIIKPERTIDKITDANLNRLSKSFRLLSIGLIRTDKRIELGIDALNKINNPNIEYYICGKNAQIQYEKKLNTLIEKNGNIIRINGYLSEEELHDHFEKCHFLLLCDKKQPSSVTNGTLMEAFIQLRPVIAPNYEPYKYYIEKYGIGILYNPEETDSLVDAINIANKHGTVYYYDNLINFQQTLLFEQTVTKFNDAIKANFRKYE